MRKIYFGQLKNKKIYGAGTDVFETRASKKNNPLFTLDNILINSS